MCSMDKCKIGFTALGAQTQYLTGNSPPETDKEESYLSDLKKTCSLFDQNCVFCNPKYCSRCLREFEICECMDWMDCECEDAIPRPDTPRPEFEWEERKESWQLQEKYNEEDFWPAEEETQNQQESQLENADDLDTSFLMPRPDWKSEILQSDFVAKDQVETIPPPTPPTGVVENFWDTPIKYLCEFENGSAVVKESLSKRYPVRRVGNTFILPAEMFKQYLPEDEVDKDPEDISLPMSFVDAQRCVKRYCERSEFFTLWFREQVDAHGESRFLDIWNEFCMEVRRTASANGKMWFPNKANSEYWHEQLFSYKRHRDQLLKHFQLRRLVAHADVEQIEVTESQKEVNSTFANQRPTVEEKAYIESQRNTQGSDFSLPEGNWHTRTMMAKPRMLENIAWSTSDEEGKIIEDYIFPGGTLLNPVNTLLSTFMYMKTGVRLRIECNSTKFNFGQLLFVFIPHFHKDLKVQDYLTTGAMMALPHGRIDASVSNSVTIDVPFVHFYNSFNLAEGDSSAYLGRFVCRVLSRLGGTTGAPSVVNCTVWVSFPDCELHQTSHVHDVPLPQSDKLFAHASVDKVSESQNIVRFVPNAVPALNFGVGNDQVTRLSLVPGGSSKSTPEITQSSRSDMDFHKLKKIESRLLSFSYKTTHSPSSVIANFPVYPTLCEDKREDSRDEGVDMFGVTMLAYVVRPFKFWRGTIKYTFIAVGNTMMSGRLMISYVPGTHLSTANDATHFNTLYWDVQEKHEISFECPYMSHRPWQRCDALLAHADYKNKTKYYAMTGRILVSVVNALTVPDTGAQSLDIMVLISAGDDFEVGFLSDFTWWRGIGVPLGKTPDLCAHAGVEVQNVRQDTRSEQPLTYQGHKVKPIKNLTFGDESMNLDLILQRYQKILSNTITIDEETFISFVNSPVLTSFMGFFNNGNGFQCRSHLSHFAQTFTMWKGSLRYVLVVRPWQTQNDIGVTLFHVPGVFRNDFTPPAAKMTPTLRAMMHGLTSAGAMTGSTRTQGSWEFEVPMYTPFTQLLTTPESQNHKWSTRCATGSVFIQLYSSLTVKATVELWQAAGNDFCLNLIRGPPQVRVRSYLEGRRTQQDDAQWWYDELQKGERESRVGLPDLLGLKQPRWESWLSTGMQERIGTGDNQPFLIAQQNYNNDKLKDKCKADLEKLKREKEDKKKSVEEEPLLQAHALVDYLPRNPYTRALDAVDAVTATSRRTESLIQDIQRRITPNTVPAEGPVEEMSFLNSLLSGIPSLLGSTTAIIGSVATLVSGFQAYLTAESHFVKACAIVAILREFFGGLISWSVEKLTQMALSVITGISGNGRMQGNQRLVGQAEVFEFIPILVGVATSALVVFGFKSIPNDKDTQELCKDISNKLRLFNFGSTAISNVKAMYKEMRDFTQWIMEQILSLAAPQYLAQMKLVEGYEDIERWAQFIDVTDTTDYVAKCNYDRNFRNEILRCADQANEYNKLLLHGKIGKEASIVRGYVQRAMKMADDTKEAYRNLPVRYDPFCVCMYGTTAMGKSAIMTDLGFAVMDRLGYPIENRWVAHNATEKFFTENYTNQDAVYIDDISLFKDKEQYQNFANLKANTQLPLNMAYRKGVHFTSHFIFTTTNVRYPELNECNENSALQRRRNILIEGRWRSRAVMDKVMRDGDNSVRENYTHLQYKVIFSIDPVLARRLNIAQPPESNWMEYPDLIEYIISRAHTHFQGQESLLRKNLARMRMPIPPEYAHLQEVRESNKQIDELVKFEVDADKFVDASQNLTAGATQEDNDVIPAPMPRLPKSGPRIAEEEQGAVGGVPAELVDENGQLLFKPESMVPARDEELVLEGNDEEAPVIVLAAAPDLKVKPPLEAHAGSEIDVAQAANMRYLSTYSPEFLETLYWSEGSHSVMSAIVPPRAHEEANDLQNEMYAFNIMVDDHKRRIRAEQNLIEGSDAWRNVLGAVEVEFKACIKRTRMSVILNKVTEKLRHVKELFFNAWERAKAAFPLLGIFETIPAKIIGVALAILGLTGIVAKVSHKCYCHSVRHLGYRCRFCGRWPQIESSEVRPWILAEWKRIYGSEPYQPGRVTKLEEEAKFFEVEDGQTIEKIWLGTKECCVAQAGPYSDITRGLAPKMVVPHGGPYSDITKGMAQTKLVAHSRVEEILESRIFSALHRIRCTYNLQRISINAVAIGGKKFLIMKHFMMVVEDAGEFEILHSGKWVPVIYEKSRTEEFPDKDLIVVEIPGVQNMKSLANHFIEEAALGKLKKTKALVARMDSRGFPQVVTTEAKAVDEVKYSFDYGKNLNTYVTRGTWKYDVEMGPGTCGSVLMTTENKSNGTILGLHICGDSTTLSYATLITKEMVERVVQRGKLGTPILKAQFLVSSLIPDGHFGHIGKVERGVFQSDKTTIIPTAIQGRIAPVKTAPAALSSRDPRIEGNVNIIRECIGKYGQVSIPFNLKHRAMITEDMIDEFSTWEIRRKPCLLSESEAIGGIEGLEGFDRLPMNTSPGYPWVLDRPQGTCGKAYLFDVEKNLIVNEELRKKLEHRERMAVLGERVESVWTCCLKDERRSFEKIRQGNTRQFVIPPVDYSILERKYMLDYSVALKDNRHKSISKVGIDPQSLEWTELYNYIAEFSNLVFAGDFKRFDGTLANDLTEDFYDCADAFYKLYGEWKPEDREVRMVLADEGIHTVCLANNIAFMTHIGNKSGNPNTVNKNGHVNGCYLKLAFLGLAEENGKLATMSEFRKNVRIAVYGDDNMVAVKPEVAEWYNQVTVAEFLSRYGLVYTNATKEGEVKPFISLEELTFLKQHFRDHELIVGIKVPHMAEQTITELLNWTRIAPDQDELLESNCNDALRFAYFRGQSYFKELRAKIVLALRAVKKSGLRIMTFTDFHFWFLFVCGMLPERLKAEGLFEWVSQNGNSPSSQEIVRLLSAIPYAAMSYTGALHRKDSKKRTDSRFAIAIPSGEGKSWLCQRYPGIFVDHDELLLPEAEKRLKEKGLSWKYLWQMLDEVEFPEDDRRILLVHHENNTKRQMLGTFKLPRANYIRANAYQRLRMKCAEVLDRDQRNIKIMKLVKKHETSLWRANGSPPPHDVLCKTK